MNTKKPLLGLDKFYYAVMLTDTTAGATYQTPAPLEGAVTMKIDPNAAIKTLFADDSPYVAVDELGELDVELSVADLSQEIDAELFGHTIVAGILQDNKADTPVNVAFGFRAKRSNGTYSYIWLLKGMFAKPAEEHETRKDGTNFQLPVLAGKFLARTYDGQFKRTTRTDATDYVASYGTNWFTSVIGTTADTTAPSLTSSVPSAASTSATSTTAVTLVFSEPIMTSTLTAANVLFVQTSAATTFLATTFTKVSSTVTVDHAAFSAVGTYNMVLTTGLKDEAGVAFTANTTVRFTIST